MLALGGVGIGSLVLLSGAPATRLELRPFPAFAYAVGYHGGNLWVGTANGEVWRYSASGEGEDVQLPGQLQVDALYPQAESTRVLADGEVFSITGKAVLPLLKLGSGIRHAVPLGEGWVAIASPPDRLLYFTLDGEGPRELKIDRLIALVEGVRKSPDAERAATDRPMSHELPRDLLQSKALIAVGGDRVALVRDSPYEVWTVGLDGTGMRIEVDESAVEGQLGGGGQVVTTSGTRRPPSWTVRGSVAGGTLVVERAIRDPQDARRAVRRISIDFIDLESGTVRNRIDTRELGVGGMWVGLRGDDGLVFYEQPGPDGPGYLVTVKQP